MILLPKFIAEAKRKTYANNKKEKRLKNGCKELRFKKREFEYIDRYFGANPFIGQEIVWKDKKKLWGMNYYGKIVGQNNINPKKVYKFLKEALREVTSDLPFRGPKKFRNGDFTYENKVKGNVKEFKGEERIFYKGKKVYQLYYHGGLING